MPRKRRPGITGTRRSTLALAAGALLVLAGAVLVVLAVGQDNGKPPGRATRPAPYSDRVTPARPCPRRSAQAGDDPSRDARGAADTDGVFRPSTRRIAATAIIAVAGASAAVPSQAQAANARSADDFVDSIGVNVHLGYNDTPYARHDIVQRKLMRLGVRHIRDGLSPNRPDMYRAFRSLARCGIKANLIVGDPARRWTIGSLSSQLDLIKKEGLGGAVASLEGPNEYDNRRGDQDWAPMLRDYQRRLYAEANTDPELRRFPVLGPSLIDPASYGRLGDVSGSLDYGNVHPYPGGDRPDGRDSDLDRHLGWATQNSRSKPVQVTETGYHNGIRSGSTHLPTTERASAIYMPRLFLDHYRQGVVRIYSYELLDERPDPKRIDSEANFGLLRNDYSEKPAFTAMRRTIDLLSDPGPRFRTARLRYSVSGSKSGVRRMLLQKRDGTFYLALWREKRVWNPGARRSVRASSKTVRVSFGRRARRIKVYRPSQSGRAVKAASNARSVRVQASPSVAIIKISSGRR